MVLRTVFSTLITLILIAVTHFAYFTQIIYYAFLRRIQKEKKQLEIKSKILERSGYDEVLYADKNELNFSSSDYNGIKQNIEQKTRK